MRARAAAGGGGAAPLKLRMAGAGSVAAERGREREMQRRVDRGSLPPAASAAEREGERGGKAWRCGDVGVRHGSYWEGLSGEGLKWAWHCGDDILTEEGMYRIMVMLDRGMRHGS